MVTMNIGKEIKKKNPLMKRIPRELKKDLGKYIALFLFMSMLIGLVSGFLVADGNGNRRSYIPSSVRNPWSGIDQSHLSFADAVLQRLDDVLCGAMGDSGTNRNGAGLLRARQRYSNAQDQEDTDVERFERRRFSVLRIMQNPRTAASKKPLRESTVFSLLFRGFCEAFAKPLHRLAERYLDDFRHLDEGVLDLR